MRLYSLLLTDTCRKNEELELEKARQDLESLLVAEEEIAQNDVESSLLRTERLLKVSE